jgi:predicted transcriptional regulator
MRKYLLLEKMDQMKLTVADMADQTGISTSSFYRKLNGESSFDLSEVVQICNVLEITDPTTKAEIFLT